MDIGRREADEKANAEWKGTKDGEDGGGGNELSFDPATVLTQAPPPPPTASHHHPHKLRLSAAQPSARSAALLGDGSLQALKPKNKGLKFLGKKSALAALFSWLCLCAAPSKPTNNNSKNSDKSKARRLLSPVVAMDSPGTDAEAAMMQIQMKTALSLPARDEGSEISTNESLEEPVAESVDHQVLLENAAGDVAPKFLLPEIATLDHGKKCLVLDLDETLVHSSFKPVPNADFIIPINIEGQYHNVYVLKRPFVDGFLKVMGDHFEIVVFTASMSNYANPVLDLLDTNKVIKHRLFREHCVYQGSYVKDLSQLGRPLEDCIIVDNSPFSYLFHPSNAVPCQTWYNDMEDDELLELQPFLIGLKSIYDVRTVLGVEQAAGVAEEPIMIVDEASHEDTTSSSSGSSSISSKSGEDQSGGAAVAAAAA